MTVPPPSVITGFILTPASGANLSFKIADKENCYINTTKVVCGTIEDLIENAELRPQRGDFESRKEYYMKNWLKAE